MKTIIFLPGLGCDERAFAHQIMHLKNKFNIKTIICDQEDNMRGHIQYVLMNSPQKIILIGHSFGGWIAQWIAINATERVDKLILMGTATGKLTPDLKKIFEDMLFHFENNQKNEFFDKINEQTIYSEKKSDSTLLALIKAMQTDFSIMGLINQVKTDLEGKETTEWLKTIKCPTLLINGKNDAFYQDEMNVLKRLIPNNTFIEIDQCGHMIPLEQPEKATTAMEGWLQKEFTLDTSRS